MRLPVGELAAIATACCWTASSLAFSAAGRRMGSLALNLIRLVLAFVFLSLFCWVQRGSLLPMDASRHAWIWLGVSGLVGFVLGDLCLFRAFVLIGPRLSMLVMALVPPIAAITGWIALGETLRPLDWIAMAVTLSGVAWVVVERAPEAEEQKPREHLARGVLLAFGGAFGQAVGLVLSKLGMQEYSPFAATQIRIIAGLAGFALLLFILRWWPRVFAGIKDTKGMGFAALGAIAGPVFGVSLSLLAIKHTQTGVAATIMAMVPVLIIPFVIVIDRERVSARAIFGALFAVAGIALLWLG